MSAEAIEARFLLLEAQVREEREARLRLEEKNVALEQQLKKQEEKLKKQAKDRETDLARFIATNSLLKSQLERKIQQEAEERKKAEQAWN